MKPKTSEFSGRVDQKTLAKNRSGGTLEPAIKLGHHALGYWREIARWHKHRHLLAHAHRHLRHGALRTALRHNSSASSTTRVHYDVAIDKRLAVATVGVRRAYRPRGHQIRGQLMAERVAGGWIIGSVRPEFRMQPPHALCSRAVRNASNPGLQG